MKSMHYTCSASRRKPLGYRWGTKAPVVPATLSRGIGRSLEIEKVCRQAGVEIEVGDDQRVYCVGVKLGNGIGAAVH